MDANMEPGMQDITAVETRRQHIICQRLHGFILIYGIDFTLDMDGSAGQPNQPEMKGASKASLWRQVYCTIIQRLGHSPLEEQTGCDIKPISHPSQVRQS